MEVSTVIPIRRITVKNTCLVTVTVFLFILSVGVALADQNSKTVPVLNGRTLYEFGESRDPAKVDQLLVALDSPDHHLRRIAIRALGKLDPEKAIKPLIKILRSNQEKPMVRATAARALGAMNAGQALEALSSCLEDAPLIRRSARKAIHRITYYYSRLASLQGLPAGLADRP